jgi:hypothetical protein
VIDGPEVLPDEFTAAVREMLAGLAALIAPGPAAQLGRLGAPEDAGPLAQGMRLRPRARLARKLGEPAPLAALRDLGPLLAERLLGALEVTVAELRLPQLPATPAPSAATVGVAMVSAGQDSAAVTAAQLAERLCPGIAAAVLALTCRLAENDTIAPLLTVEPATHTDDAAEVELAIAAAHGSIWLALAVIASSAVVAQAAPPGIVEKPAAIVGLAAGAAATALRDTPMPSGYAEAQLARIRSEYLLPRHSYGTVPVTAGCFALTESAFPTDATDFTANGLVTLVGDGVAIRTGTGEGPIRVHLSVLADPPAEVEPGWEEIVEVSWHAPAGRASVVGPGEPADPQLRRATPPWPGDYRVRVHARGRDDAGDPDTGDTEMYSLVVWAAPAAEPVVHRATDRLGHRLRGEPEPARRERPEHAYRWIRRTEMAIAATVTVVTGASTAEVLRAFGADPARAEPIQEIEESGYGRGAGDPWITLHDTGDAIVVVEFNGYQGSHPLVLRAASARGRAASMYWNVNGLTQLAFAADGEVLTAFEPWANVDAEPRVAAALAGLDFAEPGLRMEKGLVAVERFTGRGLTPALLEQIKAGDGYRIT